MDFSKLKITEDVNRQPVNEPPFHKEVIFKGEELVGLEYEPVFDFFAGKVQNAHKVLDGDFVTTEDGTGIVHIASGFGEDDFNLCKKNGIGVACPVDDGGCFDTHSKDLHEIKYKLGDKEETLELRGKQVFETNDDVIKYLKSKDLWVKTEQYLHNYPHCWRTDTPLIYKAVSSWYVKVTEFKDRMCELNKQIHWIPEHIRDGQFGKWLENARDWSITRNRFWGAPVPVWRKNVIKCTKDYKIFFEQQDYYHYSKDGKKYSFISDQDIKEFAKKDKYLDDFLSNWQDVVEDVYTEINLMLKSKGSGFIKIVEYDFNKCNFSIENKNDIWSFIRKYLTNQYAIDDMHVTHHGINSNDTYACFSYYKDLILVIEYCPSSINNLEYHFKDDYCEDFTKKNNKGAWINSGQYIKLHDNETIAEARKWDIEKIKSRFKIDNLHRPYIDELVKHYKTSGIYGGSFKKCCDLGDFISEKRVDDVLDCWFESGSMPYAQVHYPFEYRDGNGNLIRTAEENKKWFDTHFPCDFVTEYVAQTRGWFYTMVVLATALFDKIPFKNVICHGVMLDKDGQKLSKRLRNYPDPLEMIDIYGSDAMRWLMASSPVVQGGDMRIDKDGKMIADVVKNVLNPIWNAFVFYKQYAELDKIKITGHIDSQNVMDKYILSKLRLFVEQFERAMDAYNTIDACHEVELFIDVLNNWYIRRNKERFWKKEHDADKQQAYEVLHFVLKTFATATAPVLPFLGEKVYQEVLGFEN